MTLNIEKLYTEKTTVLNTDSFDRKQFALIGSRAERLNEELTKAAKDNVDNVSLMGDIFSSLYKMKPSLKSEITTSTEDVSYKDGDTLDDLMKLNGIEKELAQPSSTFNEEMMKRILLNENYDKFRQTTKLDEFSSALGTMRLNEIVSEWVKEQRQHDDNFNSQMDDLKRLQKEINSNENNIQKRKENGQNPTKKQSEKKEQLNQQKQELQQQLAQALSDKLGADGMSKLLQQATNDTNKNKDEVTSLLGGGAGSGDGELKKIPLNEQLKLASILRDTESVRHIAEWAGKFKAIAQKKQRTKHTESLDRSGMTLGSDVERLLPQELGQFIKKETKLDFLRRFSEQQTMMFSPKGKETLGKGPIVICLDESGSMHQLINQAKGFCLAVAMIAKKQGRDFCVIPFSNRVGEKVVCEKGKVTTEDIVVLATKFLGGGTKYMPPLNEAIRYIENSKRFKKADIIFVTDGDPSDTGSLNKELPTFLELKNKHSIRLMSLLIGGNATNEFVKRFSDNVIKAENFSSDTATEIFEI